MAKPLLQLRQHLRLCILRKGRVVLAGDRHRYFIQNGFIRVGCADEFVLNHHVGIHQRLEDVAVRIDNLLIIGTAIGHFNAFRHLRDLQLGILVRQFDGAQKVLRLVNLADEIQILIQPKLAEFYAISAFYSVNHQFDILGRILFVQDELLFRLHLTFAYRIDRLPIRAIVGKLDMEIHTCVRVVPLKLQTVERNCCGKRNLQGSGILNVSARPIGGEVAVQRIIGAAFRRGLGCLGKTVLRLIDVGDILRPNADFVDGCVATADARQAGEVIPEIPGCCPFRNHIFYPLAFGVVAAVDARGKGDAVRAGRNRIQIGSRLYAVEQRINLGDFLFFSEVNHRPLRVAAVCRCPTGFQVAVRHIGRYVAFADFFTGHCHRLSKCKVGRIQVVITGQRLRLRPINLKLINRNRGITAVFGAQDTHIARFLLLFKRNRLGRFMFADRDSRRIGPLLAVVGELYLVAHINGTEAFPEDLHRIDLADLPEIHLEPIADAAAFIGPTVILANLPIDCLIRRIAVVVGRCCCKAAKRQVDVLLYRLLIRVRPINFQLVDRDGGITGMLGAQHTHKARFLLFVKYQFLRFLVLSNRDGRHIGPLASVVGQLHLIAHLNKADPFPENLDRIDLADLSEIGLEPIADAAAFIGPAGILGDSSVKRLLRRVAIVVGRSRRVAVQSQVDRLILRRIHLKLIEGSIVLRRVRLADFDLDIARLRPFGSFVFHLAARGVIAPVHTKLIGLAIDACVDLIQIRAGSFAIEIGRKSCDIVYFTQVDDGIFHMVVVACGGAPTGAHVAVGHCCGRSRIRFLG